MNDQQTYGNNLIIEIDKIYLLCCEDPFYHFNFIFQNIVCRLQRKFKKITCSTSSLWRLERATAWYRLHGGSPTTNVCTCE